MKGAREIYKLSAKGGATHLTVEIDMTPDFFEMMSLA